MANVQPYAARADWSQFTPQPHFMPAQRDNNPGRGGMMRRTLEKFPKLKNKGSV